MQKIKILIILLILMQAGVWSAKAQGDTVMIQFLGKDTITEITKVEETKKVVESYKLDSSQIFDLKYTNYSQDGVVCVKAGLPELCTGICPKPSDLEIYNKGKLVKGIYGKYNRLNIGVSDDGYTVIIGFLDTDTLFQKLYLVVFEPNGNEILNKEIDIKYFRVTIKVSLNADNIALHPFKKSNLIVFNKKGEEILNYDTRGDFSNFSFFENNYLIVCSTIFFIFDLTNKKLLFESPFKPAYKFDNYNNNLIILECNSKITNSQPYFKYTYNIKIYDSKDGKMITNFQYPELINETSDLCRLNIIDNKNFNFTLKNYKYEFKINC